MAALLGADPRKLGEPVGELNVRATSELASVVAAEGVAIGIIATPGNSAQDVANEMVGAGIRSILNFSPAVLVVPDDVAVRSVDLAVELQVLSYYQHHRDDASRSSQRGSQRTTNDAPRVLGVAGN